MNSKLQSWNAQCRSNWHFFVLCDLEIWLMILQNNRAALLCYFKFCASFHSHLKLQSRNAKFGCKSVIIFQVWPWNLIDDLENNRASLLCYFKLCASFHSHRSVRTEVTVWKRQFRSKSTFFLSCVNFKFDWWPCKTTGHLFFATSSIVHHFIAISELKLELQSGNALFRWKSAIFFTCDLEIWQMTLKNNMAPLLCYFKLCESLHNHW